MMGLAALAASGCARVRPWARPRSWARRRRLAFPRCPRSRPRTRTARPATSRRRSRRSPRDSGGRALPDPARRHRHRQDRDDGVDDRAGRQRPALVIAHNKTLAAQLCNEFREFFPENAVEYFVSYYDYYQPEAYVPQADLYIEKDSSRNDDIDRLRHSATSALLSRRDDDHRRLGLVHLRPRLARGVREARRRCCTSARSRTATTCCAS